MFKKPRAAFGSEAKSRISEDGDMGGNQQSGKSKVGLSGLINPIYSILQGLPRASDNTMMLTSQQ